MIKFLMIPVLLLTLSFANIASSESLKDLDSDPYTWIHLHGGEFGNPIDTDPSSIKVLGSACNSDGKVINDDMVLTPRGGYVVRISRDVHDNYFFDRIDVCVQAAGYKSRSATISKGRANGMTLYR